MGVQTFDANQLFTVNNIFIDIAINLKGDFIIIKFITQIINSDYSKHYLLQNLKEDINNLVYFIIPIIIILENTIRYKI